MSTLGGVSKHLQLPSSLGELKTQTPPGSCNPSKSGSSYEDPSRRTTSSLSLMMRKKSSLLRLGLHVQCLFLREASSRCRMSACGLGNPMERKVVSQRASRPLGVPQSSMGIYSTTSKTAWAALPTLNCQRRNRFDLDSLRPLTVQPTVPYGKYYRLQIQRREIKAIGEESICFDSLCAN